MTYGFALITTLILASLKFVPHPPYQPGSRPELQLRILLEKETYARNETAFTRTEFVNLTDETLCFPEPAQGIHDSVPGYLITEATPPSGNKEFFQVILNSRWPDRENLSSDIERSWIKLAPNQVYVSKHAQVRFKLDTVGEWLLTTTYYPTEATYGSPPALEELRNLTARIGCRPPKSIAAAPSEKVHVFEVNE